MEETLCPLCKGPMVPRKNGSTGQKFWGCKAYPKCKGTRDTDGEAPKPLCGTFQNNGDDELPSSRMSRNDKSRWRE